MTDGANSPPQWTHLNLLGTREPRIYGASTLAEIENKLKGLARAQGHELIATQSNAEHELVAKVQSTQSDGVAFVIINPGAFTHTSIALRDAFLSVSRAVHRGSPEQRICT